MKQTVFISYSSHDRATADAVCGYLESRQIQCWIAPRDIPAGMSFVDAIVDAIDECRVFVLILSASSNDSPQVLSEVLRVVNRNIPIIPLRIDETPLSKTMDFYISRYQWLDAKKAPLDSHLKHLADTAKRLLERDEIQSKIETAEAAISVEKPSEPKIKDQPQALDRAFGKKSRPGCIRLWGNIMFRGAGISFRFWVGNLCLAGGISVQLLEAFLFIDPANESGLYIVFLAIGLPLTIIGVICLWRALVNTRDINRGMWLWAASLLWTTWILVPAVILTNVFNDGMLIRWYTFLVIILPVIPICILGSYAFKRGYALGRKTKKWIWPTVFGGLALALMIFACYPSMANGVISGYVYQTGTSKIPVAGARITVWNFNSLSGKEEFKGYATTDTSGRYRTIGVPAGEYGVQVQAEGLAGQWYSGVNDKYRASPVKVLAQNNTADVNFIIETTGVISGIVRDQNSGKSLEGFKIFCISMEGGSKIGGLSDQIGNYKIAVPFGKYKIYIDPDSNSGYGSKFYLNSPDGENAVIVSVTSQKPNLEKIDFDMSK